MKYAALYYKDTENFGDDIQCYAALQYLPSIDYVIDREKIDDFVPEKKEYVATICNGWYQHRKYNFPMSPYIYPKLVAMHFTNQDPYDIVEKRENYDYLDGFAKDVITPHGPVGCRDYGTLNMLKEKGYDCYFSGCLTLTIDKIGKVKKQKYICLVDLDEKIVDYIKSITDMEVKVITHAVDPATYSKLSFEERMENVKEYLTMYQNASLVITNRLHVALPCLALETKVALVYYDCFKDRLETYKEYLTTYEEKEILNENIETLLNIENPTKYLEIRNTLKEECKKFIDETKKVKLDKEKLPDVEFYKNYLIPKCDYMENIFLNGLNEKKTRIAKMERQISTLNETVNVQKKREEKLKCYLKFGIISILSIIFLSILCKNNNIWYDEYYTFEMIKHSIFDIIKITSFDVHPPLYYLLLKVYTCLFGSSLFSLKLFSMLPLLGILFINEILVKKMYGKKVSNIFNVIFLTSSIVMQYAIEIRMYSLSMFLLYGMIVYALKFQKHGSKRSLLFMTLFSILGIYTHYYVLLSAFILYMIMVIINIKDKKKLLKLIISGIANFICYLPWLFILFNQVRKVKEDYWISSIKFSDLLNYPKELFLNGNYTNIFIIFILLIIGILVVLFVRKKLEYKKDLFICVSTFALTLIISLLISILFKPILISRYLTISIIACLILFLSIGIGNIKSNKIVIFIMLIFIIFGMNSYIIRYNIEHDNSKQYIDTIEKYITKNDAVLFTTSKEHGVITKYYFDKFNYYSLVIDDNSPFENIKEYKKQELDKYDNIYLIKKKETNLPKSDYEFEKQEDLHLDEWEDLELYRVKG